MKIFVVDEWKQTVKPKPFGEPIDGEQAMMSEGYFEKKEAVLVEDVLAFLELHSPNSISAFKHQLRRKKERRKCR